jgi:hypothetical protein
MAQKIPRRNKPAPTPQADNPAEELDILHPERTVTVGALRLVIREYGHMEWMRLLPAARPVIDAIAGMLEAGREPAYEEAFEAIAANADALLPLVAQAADIAPEELAALAPDTGELVLMTWWGVNGRFFIGRAINRVAVARAAAMRRSDGASFTPPSSLADTTAPNSPATPPGN